MDLDFSNGLSFWWNISNYKKMKNRNIKFFIISLLVIFIFTTLAIGLKKESTYTTENINIENIENFRSKELFSNEPIEFTSLFDQNEKFIILNIWASWCLPCRSEHEFLMKLSQNSDIKIVGLNYKDNQENAKEFLKELGNPFEKILIDRKGLIAIEIGAYGIPETYLIDNYDKKIIKKYIGPIDKIKMERIISILKL